MNEKKNMKTETDDDLGKRKSDIREVQIIEYELAPKAPSKREKKKTEDMSFDDLFLMTLPMMDDVKNEESFKLEMKHKQAEQERTTLPANTVTHTAYSPNNLYSIEQLQLLCDQMTEQIKRIEFDEEIEIQSQEITNRCWKIRDCPEPTCMAHQAHNPRCWYLAGEHCGCRTHLGIPSCFDCQVFQMSALEPYTRIREILYYVLGMIRNRQHGILQLEGQAKELNERLSQLRSFSDNEASFDFDTYLSDPKMVGNLMNLRKPLTDGGEEGNDQHKLLTEQLGSAYLQLQVLTSQLEKTNAELEQKVNERTEDLRKSNMALREAIKKAQEADRLKSEFIANVSHELRTPLNSIIGFSKVLISRIDGEINPTQEVDLNAIYNSGRHLLDIINSILDLSKIEAGKMEMNFTEVELGPLIDDIVTAGQTLIMGRRVRLDSRFLNEIPAIEADATKIRQVIFNLVSNAAKFTEEGWITIQVGLVSDHISISVIDTGIGIDKDSIHSIFERFRQADGSSTRRTGGTGLGLSIARKFIEMHNGTITVESKLGKGSVFTMSLPLHQPERKPAEINQTDESE
jgi:signal transduction histidine kinase